MSDDKTTLYQAVQDFYDNVVNPLRIAHGAAPVPNPLEGTRFSWSQGKFPNEPGFIECDSCRAKPGSPTLCYGCIHNRKVIQEQVEEIRKYRGKISEMGKEIANKVWEIAALRGRIGKIVQEKLPGRRITVKLEGWGREYLMHPEDTELLISLDAVTKDAIRELISAFSSGIGIYGVCKEDGEFSRGVQFAINRMRRVFRLEDDND